MTLGALLINLATGYMRLVAIIFSPLNLVTGASGVPIGTYIADMVNIINRPTPFRQTILSTHTHLQPTRIILRFSIQLNQLVRYLL